MPWGRQAPEHSEAQSEKRNLALQLGVGAIAIAAIAIGAWVTDKIAWWSSPALILGACLVVVGVYGLVGVPLLGFPFPSGRSEPIWRGAWSGLPFSIQGRQRRREAQNRALRDRLLNLLAGEAMRSGLTARRAAQSPLEATLNPGPRNYWVALVGGGQYMLGFDASGNIVEVDDPDLESPEVEARIKLFEAIVAEARTWPELRQLERLGP